jgi:hypothetical protein
MSTLNESETVLGSDLTDQKSENTENTDQETHLEILYNELLSTVRGNIARILETKTLEPPEPYKYSTWKINVSTTEVALLNNINARNILLCYAKKEKKSCSGLKKELAEFPFLIAYIDEYVDTIMAE